MNCLRYFLPNLSGFGTSWMLSQAIKKLNDRSVNLELNQAVCHLAGDSFSRFFQEGRNRAVEQNDDRPQ
jgi:hypothetical protein